MDRVNKRQILKNLRTNYLNNLEWALPHNFNKWAQGSAKRHQQ